MHGDPPERVRAKIADMRRRRERLGLPPLQFGLSGYVILRDTEDEAERERQRVTDVSQSAAGYQNFQDWVANTKLEQQLSIEDYSVSNRGLRSGLIGTPEQVAEQIERFADAGVDLLLLQFSPQFEEMERFAAQVIAPSRKTRAAIA
jgi:FMNH2-dependent dimethyl sulfone monooxygenase